MADNIYPVRIWHIFILCKLFPLTDDEQPLGESPEEEEGDLGLEDLLPEELGRVDCEDCSSC